jgi:hypothetical protein
MLLLVAMVLAAAFFFWLFLRAPWCDIDNECPARRGGHRWT